jgi:hypothetical protein
MKSKAVQLRKRAGYTQQAESAVGQHSKGKLLGALVMPKKKIEDILDNAFRLYH